MSRDKNKIIESLVDLANDLYCEGHQCGIGTANADKWFMARAVAMQRVASGEEYTSDMVIEIFVEESDPCSGRNLAETHWPDLVKKHTKGGCCNFQLAANELAELVEKGGHVVSRGCKKLLAPGQHWAFCGETDMGQTAPALCTECGGEFKLAE